MSWFGEDNVRTIEHVEGDIKECLTVFLCNRDDAKLSLMIDGLTSACPDDVHREHLVTMLTYFTEECEAVGFTHSVSYHRAKKFVEAVP